MSFVMTRRAIIVVIDGVGAGALPDAAQFHDEDTNTLGNLSHLFPDGLSLPNLAALGLGNITEIVGVDPDADAKAAWGKCMEMSPAKDTTIGHWEIAGLVSTTPQPVYPEGFPPEIMEPFEQAIGIGTLGNVPASGTEIIKQLGAQHMETKKPIVYTSGDSVFQIATHEDLYPPKQLYEMCMTARRLLDGPHRVGRVIARPFAGVPGDFVRTKNRKDFAVPPPAPTLLDAIKDAGLSCVGIGKIGDIFCHQGLTKEIATHSNDEGMLAMIMQINEAIGGLIITNLVETDMLYGHRNDPYGYRRALEYFDSFVPRILTSLQGEDLLIITSDHGCDPTTPGTNHTREHTPLLVYSKMLTGGTDLGVRQTFADIGATVAEYLGLETQLHGTSFLGELALVEPQSRRA